MVPEKFAFTAVSVPSPEIEKFLAESPPFNIERPPI
jgi:hypothetical protein